MGEQELQDFRLRNALHRQFGDQYDVDIIRKIVEWAIEEMLTPTQRKYYCLRYGEGISMAAIGRMHAVHTSTVSRTLARATNRIRKVLRIVAPLLPNKGKPRRCKA
jgi:DNA-directed RNA polymerase specialized sigma24 family protein